MESIVHGSPVPKAVARALEIFHAEQSTPEVDELALLLVLVKDYEDKHVHLPNVDPIEAVKLKWQNAGCRPKIWSQAYNSTAGSADSYRVEFNF
ncbi:hypothetical protein [Parapedobacter defluvii]|uniref:hypothetical protein n=1 Tax=Parapedobacter defluvii TaxID=2045106 RepID=UPI000FA59DD4|nr:MAG: hypothetical protein EAS52_24505 [Parapedobacter sp.]